MALDGIAFEDTLCQAMDASSIIYTVFGIFGFLFKSKIKEDSVTVICNQFTWIKAMLLALP